MPDAETSLNQIEYEGLSILTSAVSFCIYIMHIIYLCGRFLTKQAVCGALSLWAGEIILVVFLN